MIFPKIVPTRVFTTKIEKTFYVFSSEPVGLFLERASCCSINSTHLNPALYAAGKVTVGLASHWPCDRRPYCSPQLHRTHAVYLRKLVIWELQQTRPTHEGKVTVHWRCAGGKRFSGFIHKSFSDSTDKHDTNTCNRT